MSDTPYALFGGYNSSQIVQGERGIRSFKNQPGDYKASIKSWALMTKDISYDGKTLHYQDQTKNYPAVIDTGSSFIAVPPDEHNSLVDKWRETLSDLDCKTDPTFCSSYKKCSDVEKVLKPVQFNIEDTIFEMKPKSYLH